MQITSVNADDSDNESLSLERINNNSTVSLYSSIENHISADQTCSICQNDFENNDIIRKINNCNHSFHLNCIDRWLQNHVTCPSCRYNLLSSTPSNSNTLNNSRNVISSSSESEYSDVTTDDEDNTEDDDSECECTCLRCNNNEDMDEESSIYTVDQDSEDDEDIHICNDCARNLANNNSNITVSQSIPPITESIQQPQTEPNQPLQNNNTPTQSLHTTSIIDSIISPVMEQSTQVLTDISVSAMPELVTNILTRGLGVSSNTTASMDNVLGNLIVTGTPIIREIISNGTSNTSINTSINATVNDIMQTISPFANLFNDFLNNQTNRGANNRR
jgi:hypothetical protein